MKPFDVESLRRAIRDNRVEWRKHVLQKLAERGLAQSAVLDVLLTGERIRDYIEDRLFPSALFLGFAKTVNPPPLLNLLEYLDRAKLEPLAAY